MTLDQIIRMFPEKSVALLRVARGSEPGRKLVWVASWDAGYFTSDTDRHVYHGQGYADVAFGDTAEEALEMLAHAEIKAARAMVSYHEKELLVARDLLAAASRRLEES